MTKGRHTELQLYLEMLERQFGVDFPLEVLSNEELAILDHLARYAVDKDELLPETDKLQWLPLLGAVREQQCLRSRYGWLAVHAPEPGAAGLPMTRVALRNA